MMRALPAVPIIADTHVVQPLCTTISSRQSAPVSRFPLRRSIASSTWLAPRRSPNDSCTIASPASSIGGRCEFRCRISRRHGARLAEGLRMAVPFEASHLAFATADDTELHSGQNGLATLFGIAGTGLTAGLTRLIHELEELIPSEGAGSTEVKRFSADIRDFAVQRGGPAATVPPAVQGRHADRIGVEPVAPQSTLEEKAVISMALPGRGHVQVRVEEVTDDYVVLATLRGHALAGIVRFSATPVAGGAVRFEVTTCDAAANAVDWITLTLGGARIQDAHWKRLVQNVVTLAGGRPMACTHTPARSLRGAAQRGELDAGSDRKPSPRARDVHHQVGPYESARSGGAPPRGSAPDRCARRTPSRRPRSRSPGRCRTLDTFDRICALSLAPVLIVGSTSTP